ncbi:hypothetical protein LguiA_018045 [Lonicera macranthoides]
MNNASNPYLLFWISIAASRFNLTKPAKRGNQEAARTRIKRRDAFPITFIKNG